MEKRRLSRGSEYANLARPDTGFTSGRTMPVLFGAGRFHKDETADQQIGPEVRLNRDFLKTKSPNCA